MVGQSAGKMQMIDRKSLAAGEHEEYEAPRPRFQPRLAPDHEEKFKIVPPKCDRCGQMPDSFVRCAGCDELDNQLCACGGKVKDHRFGRGTRANKRFWICKHCFPICTQISCDPVKQTQMSIDGRKQWVDVI